MKENLKKVKNRAGFEVNPQNINRNGRPRKFVSEMKMQGYKIDEINRCIENLLALNLDELEKVGKDDKATMLERIMSVALFNSLKKGSLQNLETLLTRRWAAPVQRSEINQQAVIQVTAPDAETKKWIDEL